MIVALPLFIYFLFFGPSFFFSLYLFWGTMLYWMMIITLLFIYNSMIQLDTRTKYDYMDASGGVPGCAMMHESIMYVNEMHMMTWYVMHETQAMTRQQQWITGRHLAHRSRGVTTLHHYGRISSQDLEWHRMENGREREEVKLSCFFDKRVKPKTLERLSHFEKRIQLRWMKLITLR